MLCSNIPGHTSATGIWFDTHLHQATVSSLSLCLCFPLCFRCATIYHIPGSWTQTVQCRGMEGRFINLYKSCSTNAVIALCEVKVYGGRNPVPSLHVTKVHQCICWSTIICPILLVLVQLNCQVCDMLLRLGTEHCWWFFFSTLVLSLKKRNPLSHFNNQLMWRDMRCLGPHRTQHTCICHTPASYFEPHGQKQHRCCHSFPMGRASQLDLVSALS